MSRNIGHPIAVRRYGVEGEPERQIVLVIGEPIAPGSQDGEWSCPVMITGLSGRDFFHYVPGVDAIQALQLAMRRARSELEASKLPITWLGQTGDIGLARTIDPVYGPRFQRLMESIYDLTIDMIGHIALELVDARKAEPSEKKARKTSRKKGA